LFFKTYYHASFYDLVCGTIASPSVPPYFAITEFRKLKCTRFVLYLGPETKFDNHKTEL